MDQKKTELWHLGGDWFEEKGSGDLGIADSSFKPPSLLWGLMIFSTLMESRIRILFDNPDPNPDYDDDDPDPYSDDDPNPEFVSDSDLNPDFDSDSSLDSGSDSDPNSYSTCILCIFRCTDYDF
ncbi:hypothetical protein L3X38_010020 [Prunus dulcis]|uniref:Uncharacterized protein n=1 Tax=Prunus dulcis TaxID=3755 RepID=A0AAD4ZDM3_PRUDU|nr:hypothetical protein L3X38_010020 [Prunus dulcis]